MPIFSRRLFFKSAAAASAAAVEMTIAGRCNADNQRWASPLAQDYTVIFKCPEPHIYTAAASLLRLPGGRLLSSFALFTRMGRKPGHPDREIETLFCASSDDGATWHPQGSVKLGDGLTFVHQGKLYHLCNRPGRRDIVLVKSDDEAKTWSEPVTLFEGSFWNTFTPHVVRGDTLYWALGASNEAGNFNRIGSRTVVVAGDLSATYLMRRTAWRISPYLTYPGTPQGLSASVFPHRRPDGGDHWLEPNIVEVGGRLRVLLRIRIDSQATAHMCAVCDVDDDGQHIDYKFTQFYPMPGAQGYFHIVRDQQTGYFWTAVNMPTKSQDADWGRELNARGFLGNPGNERRFLILLYSVDALNWFQAGCVAKWPSPLQGFQYAAPLIDRDDLLITSRTAKNRKNQHDNDLLTLHRVRNFRSLALNLLPEYPQDLRDPRPHTEPCRHRPEK